MATGAIRRCGVILPINDSAQKYALRAPPAHVSGYNPAYEHILDYSVCFQCGIVLRFFANPPESRRDRQYAGQLTDVERLLVEQT